MEKPTEPAKSGGIAIPPALIRFRTIGPDGFTMLIASCAVIVATGGMGFAVCLGYAAHRAWHTPSSRSKRQPAPVVLVPGVRLSPSGDPVPDFVARLERARQFAPARILVLGGRTRAHIDISEATAGREWLIAKGSPAGHIDREESSRNTLENLCAVRQRLGPAAPSTVLISNRYHLARIGLLASGLGMPLDLCPAEERLPLTAATLGKLLMEAFFIHWYFVGRGIARLFRRQSMLARIS